MIVFINCYEEMASGMRLLAAMAKDRGFPVHIIVLRGYEVKITSELDETNSSMHVLVNGEFHVNPLRTRQFTDQELWLLRMKLAELKPGMVCISTRSANDPLMPLLLESVRRNIPSSVPIICGGYGPTYAPEYYLRNGADYVAMGEGEISFMRLLDDFKNKRQFTDVPGLAWLEDDKLRRNPLAPPLRDLSALPSALIGHQYVSFIDENNGETRIREYDPAYDNKTFCVLVGRGCIGKCAYCAAPVQKTMYMECGYHLPAYRRRSYVQVLDELDQARKAGATRIFFKDEYLVDTPSALSAFFREYKKRIGLPFRANLHIRQLLTNRELLDAVIDADLHSLTVGFQSGTEEMARKTYDRPHSFADLKRISDILFQEYVSVQFHFVSGTSLNTADEFSDKCKLIASLPYDPLMPWRTALFDFQFFPQPRSKMTMNIGEGQLKRLPTREWAKMALGAQLFHFASAQEAAEACEEAERQMDPVNFLRQKYEYLREKSWTAAFDNLTNNLAGQQILIMGEGVKTFGNLWKKFAVKDIGIAGRVSFPGCEATGLRIRPECIHHEYGSEMPLLVFDWASKKYIRKLKREYKLANPIYGVCAFTRRFFQ